MTEQSKIPLPGKAKSLFERAEELFGVDGFVLPPVPENVRFCPQMSANVRSPPTKNHAERTHRPPPPRLSPRLCDCAFHSL